MDQLQADDNFQWGVRAFHNGFYNQAIFYFEKALGFKPLNILERLWLGRALYKSGFEEAALNEWNSLLSRGKGTMLLENTVRIITMRRGFGPEITEPDRLVISSVIDASKKTYRKFKRPSSVRARKDGSLYIVAFGTNEILEVDVNGTIINVLKGGLEGFDHPFDVLETEQFLFVSEYEGNRISKCTLNGEKTGFIGKRGIKDGELLGPQFLAMDSKGYLYVTDYGNKRVNKYDQDGTFILSFGGRKNGRSLFDGPTGIDISRDNVFVSDVRKKRIFVFDQSGNLLKEYDDNFLKGPEGLYFADPDTLLIADTAPFAQDTRIVRLDVKNEEWKIHTTLGKDAKHLIQAAIDPNGDLFTVDYNLNKVFGLSPISALSSGFFVQIERIDANSFPEVIVDVTVQDRFGRPVSGLNKNNFILTESFISVGEVSMNKPVQESENFEIVLLIEKSRKISRIKDEIEAAVEGLFTSIGSSKKIMIVSAGKDPVFEADVDASTLTKRDVVHLGDFSEEWRFSAGLRMAATKLLPFRAKRAVVFLSEGSLPGEPFSDYSLLELTYYLRNNHIRFYTVHLGKDSIHEDISFLCEETGGKVYSFHAPGGITSIIGDIIAQEDPRYVLTYQSRADTRFGRRFLPCEVEVNMRKRSGRDENGYFGPIRY